MTCPDSASRDTTDGILSELSCFPSSPFLVDLRDSKASDIEEIDDIGAKIEDNEDESIEVSEDINYGERVEENFKESYVDDVFETIPIDSMHNEPILVESTMVPPPPSYILSYTPPSYKYTPPIYPRKYCIL